MRRVRSFGARVRGPTDRFQTAELRLACVGVEPGSAWLEVEVRESPALVDLSEAWHGAEVRVGAHWLDGRGRTIQFDGPRTDRVALNELRLAAVRRRLRLEGRPDGGERLAVELVAEGVAWGASVGLRPLGLRAPRRRLPFSRPRPVAAPPPPESPAATRAWLASAWPADARREEMAAYVGADLARFLMSVQLLASPGRTLEIGANPYFMTRLIVARHPEAELTLTNYFGGDDAAMEQDVVDASGSIVQRFRSDLVDVEAQPLPYADASFDTVLLCEVIEHFIADPVFAIGEMHRVLVSGGQLLLTTPNVARAGNLHRLAQRQGIYDPYSRYGPHGRHNREYTAGELIEVLTGNGFEIERSLTRPVHAVADPDPTWFAAADDDGAGDYHFVLARRGGSAGPVRPPWLYR